ncbi:MAG: tyrosine--tRNA ligase [Nanoarchaeota archaeon]
MTPEERFKLIARGCEEIITREGLMKLLEEKKQPKVYLGTAVTGRPHVGYFVWVLKLADFLKAGFQVKLLLADLHGALDRTPWELLEARFEYYSEVIPAMFGAIGQDISNFEIVKGSAFQKNADYFYDVLRLATFTTQHDAKKAGSEVVKQDDNPKLAGLIYPLMQALDEEYLDVDIQYGGVDQRKILMFAREYLPKIGYHPRIEVMTPLIPGLVGEKMSASVEGSKIDLLDDSEVVKRKLNKAFCPEGEVEGNGVVAFITNVVFPLKEEMKEPFIIRRQEKFGGNISFKTAREFIAAYEEKKVHPMDVKGALFEELEKLISPIRKHMHGKDALVKKAYP